MSMKTSVKLALLGLLLLVTWVSCKNKDDSPQPNNEPNKPDTTVTTKMEPCNGDSSLCNRKYDEVAYPTTHNAFNYAAGGNVRYLFPNQNYPIDQQLTQGIRAFMIDVHEYQGFDNNFKGKAFVYHNKDLRGVLGQEPLVNVLQLFSAFLKQNPREVVTLILEATAPWQQIQNALTEANLLDSLHIQEKGKPWPTLLQMIQSHKRLVVLTDDSTAGRPSWYHYVWDFGFETNWNIKKPEEFTCAYNRGNPAYSLFVLNNFVYASATFLGQEISVADSTKAAIVNTKEFLVTRALACSTQTGRIPNFVTVDFAATGNLMGAVDSLNKQHHPR